MTFPRLAAATLMSVVIFGSAGEAEEERSILYTPVLAVVSTLGAQEASRIVREAAERSMLFSPGLFFYPDKAEIDKSVLTLYQQGKVRMTFALQDIDPRVVNLKITRATDQVVIDMTDGTDFMFWWNKKNMDPGFMVSKEKGLTTDPRYPGPTLRQISDALFVLNSRAALLAGSTYVRRFDEAVVRYRGAAATPDLPEEVRRYMVQAEALVRNQDPDRAAGLYVLALEVAPWWAEGHYNLAMFLATSNDFTGAVTEMRRYLALKPAAPNARAAQDKIYEWEVQVR